MKPPKLRHAATKQQPWSNLIAVFFIHSIVFPVCWSAITQPKTHKTGSNFYKDSNRQKQAHRNYMDPQYAPSPLLDDLYDASINSLQPVPDEQLLIARLLKNYDPAARPVYNASKSVVVRFGFLLVQICDMDERNQILTTNVWLEQEWFDERLQWNQSEFNNLDKIRIPCNRIWLPDIVLYNSADDFTESFMQSKAMVKPNGEVFWPPPAKLRSSCKIDVTFFPFDDQVCLIKFGSWTYSGLQVDLVNKSHTTDLTNYIKSGEWELKYVIVERNLQYYPCCPEEPYPDIVFYIHIRRRILYYLFNIILPCVWLSILSLIGFWLPPDTGEKITLGITVLLAFSVFMLLIAENIPATSEMVPLIGIYLTVTMSLTSLSIILTVFVLQLHYAGQYSPRISRTVYKLMTRKLAYVMCMSSTVQRYEDNMRRQLDKYKSGGGGNQSSSKTKLLNCDREVSKLKSTLSQHHHNHHSTPTKHGRVKSNIGEFCCCCCSTGEHSSSSSSTTEQPIKQNGGSHSHRTHLTNECEDGSFECATSSRRGLSATTTPRKQSSIHHQTLSSHHHHHCLDKLNQWSQTPANHRKHPASPAQGSKSPHARVCNQHQQVCCCCYQSDSQPPQQPVNRELLESLDIFSRNLKEYLVKQEVDAIKANCQSEWKLVALIVDRVLFWVFTFLTLVSTLVLLVGIPIWKNEYLAEGGFASNAL